MILLDGKATAAAIRAELKTEIECLAPKAGRPPGLAVILVGEDPASQIYVRNKHLACEEAGFVSRRILLPADVSQQDLESTIDDLNQDPEIDGILLQLPLPAGLDSRPCLERISPAKDVDGFHPESMGRLVQGLPGFLPCTPAGVLELLKRYDLKTRGRRAVVVGRSNIVGRPLANLLCLPGEMGDATVTVCHSRTPDLGEVTRQADFLFAAVGRAKLIGRDMVKEGAVVVDVGMNRLESGRLAGDCDFEALMGHVRAITPVPGGVGPMTIAQLLINTMDAFRKATGADGRAET